MPSRRRSSARLRTTRRIIIRKRLGNRPCTSISTPRDHEAWNMTGYECSLLRTVGSNKTLRVVGHGYCAALKECADLGFVVN